MSPSQLGNPDPKDAPAPSTGTIPVSSYAFLSSLQDIVNQLRASVQAETLSPGSVLMATSRGQLAM